MASFRLGENQKALDDLQVVIAKDPEAVSAKQYRVIALARLGKKQDARTELEKLQRGDAPDHSKLYLAAIVAAELGEGVDKSVQALEAAIKKQPEDADLRYDAARAFSLASKAISRSDKTKGRHLADRCLQLLREAVKNDDADFGSMDEDADLDPVRDDPAFGEIMKAGHPERRYAAIWSSDARFEATPLFGLDPAAHLTRCRELAAQGYRPASLSVARTKPDGAQFVGSVWHRPVVEEEVKDRLAESQARAAIALARMGKAEEVWPLLRHSPDPRLRSFIVNWLKPLGVDPEISAAEFARLRDVERGSPDPAHGAERRSPAAGQPADSGRPLVPEPHTSPKRQRGDRPADPSLALRAGVPGTPEAGATIQTMDAILFDPDTSIRRAVILALGTYKPEDLSPGERDALIARLLVLYRDDPDAGIHGAAGWTLRQWKHDDDLKAAQATLAQLRDRGSRRWFVNSQGQTFAVIEGPVEFRMGSPPTDTERTPGSERSRRMRIPRRFAIADKEVTVEQFQRFLTLARITIDSFHLPPGFVAKYCPDSEGPQICADWYIAAQYCNWLSEQEGLPKDQWCYLPNGSGVFAAGMSIPANVLERRGYRLPTEAEWEYACRAGAGTSRYYGHSIELLEAYAWYQANSKEHAWVCGGPFSNDLGVFDMLGNEYEWCQDRFNASKSGQKGVINDIIRITEYIDESHPRPLRGGSFGDPPSNVRSATRIAGAPAYRFSNFGFRPARTYH